MRRVLFLILLAPFFATAQPAAQKLVLTEEQNSAWIDSLERLPLHQQLAAIRKRLLDDTAVYVRRQYNDRAISLDIVRDSAGTKTEGFGKPLLAVEKLPMPIGNHTPARQSVALAALLTEEHIRSVTILKGAAATAIYGRNGVAGVLYLTSSGKKSLRKFRALALQPGRP